MYTQFRRFVATALLPSILLQGCGNPNWKIAGEESLRGTSAKTCCPFKIGQRSKSSELATAANFTEGFLESEEGPAPALGDESPAQRPTEVSAGVANTPTLASVRSSAVPATSQRTPASKPVHPLVPLMQTKVLRKRAASKPLCVVLDQTSVAGHVHHEDGQALAMSGSLQAMPANGLLETSWSSKNSRRHPHPKVMHVLQATEHRESYTKPATNLAFQAYAGAQGHQVRFREVDGKWLAQVQDGWGREQLLPVVCANLQAPGGAIGMLSNKSPGQHKCWVHVLETNHPPWAPRCVYVGRLGIRGGMGKEAKRAPKPAIANRLQHNLQLHMPSAGERSLLAQAQAAHEHVANAQKGEDTKMPSLSRVTTFTTPAAAQKAVEAYLKRWRLAIPSGCAELREQGKDILKGVEVLKKTTKHSHRQQVLGFETSDVDPLVWHVVFQQQQTAKEQLEALRGLRTQLLDILRPQGEELQAAGIRIATNTAARETELYSSDEETQQLSDQSKRNHAAFVAGVGKVLQGHTKELLELLDEAMGTTIAHHITLLSSVPKLPDLLVDYVEAFLHEADEERRAELLGSLLAEAILQFVPLPKGKKSRLKGIKHALGKAAERVISQRFNRSNTLVRPGKTPEGISKFGQEK